MKGAWAIRLALGDAGALASLRLAPGVEVAIGAEAIWARGRHSDESFDSRLRGIPVEARFAWQDNDRLLQQGNRIPSGVLPGGPWVPIAEWLSPRLSLPALPGALPQPAHITLQRSPIEQSPTLLLTDLSAWLDFAANAPEIRLSRLCFAINGHNQALIRGTPLPPLPGQRWVELDGVAVPIGFVWDPPVSATVLVKVMGATANGLVLWFADERIARIHAEQFIPASRSNVHASCLSRLAGP